MLFTFVGSVLVRCLTVLCKGHVLWLGLVVGLSSVLYAPVKPLIDAAVMSIIKDKADYGRSRLYGQIGLGIGSMIVGPFLSNHLAWIFAAQLLLAIPTALIMASPSFALQPITFNEDEPMSDYTNNSNRYRYRMINVLAGLKTYLQDKVKLLQKKKEALSMEEEKPPVHVCKAITRVFRDSQVAVFFGVVFLIGVTSGVIENFAYLRISEIATASNRGASLGNILGVCRLLSSLAGGPMFWLSGRIVQGLGINGVLSLSLLAYILRFLIYAYAHNPWHTLPAEVLRGLTFAIFWSGCTYHVYAVSPRAFTATMVSMQQLINILFI